MQPPEQLLITRARVWACIPTDGNTLEVAVGTGCNPGRFRSGIKLTGSDLSA